MLDIDNRKCCGCQACQYVCPKDAITMQRDEYGFRYPHVDKEKCISCGLCESVCAFQDNKRKALISTYAAANTNKKQKEKSSSGGIFAALAEEIIKEGGVVCGAELKITNNKATVNHCVIDKLEDICKLQGSKYVQSNLTCFKEIEDALKSEKRVLFSGTPCQVAQIQKMFLKYEELLTTVDIICHGVPNQKWFNEYLDILVGKNQLVDFNFRNKENGWGTTAFCKVMNKKGKYTKKHLKQKTSSYYGYFLECENFRESCYFCPYASTKRMGDITLGDCWGIEVFAPQLLSENGGEFEKEEGISCLLVNSEKGNELLKKCEKSILKKPVDINDVVVINKQLREPAVHTKTRKNILKIYVKGGYRSVDIYFNIINFLKKMKHRCWQSIHKKNG